MPLEIDLKNKVALITGVTSGLGAGIAKMFAHAGADIAGCGRSAAGSDEATAFKRNVADQKRQSLYLSADVTNKTDMERLVASAISTFGKIDILVSNAGVNMFEGASACSEERWKDNREVNLTAHWRLAKYCRPYLEKTAAGVIIIIASNHAFQTIPGCFPYNVAKTALTGLVKSLAIEWGPRIRTVGLAPGFIDTPGNQNWFNSFPDPAKEKQRTIGLHPVKRIGTTEEVGAWCVFLSSDYASFSSGVTYLLDGGRSALMQDNEV
jgi:NAD(P)-dependent dehydrogenase (short-subunit alcohol dehydrogenase family)